MKKRACVSMRASANRVAQAYLLNFWLGALAREASGAV